MNSNNFTALLLASARLAVALVMTAIALTLLGWGAYSAYKYREDQKLADLAKPQKMPEQTIEALKIKCKLVTIWRTGAMQYQFSVEGDPELIDRAKHGTEDAALWLTFVDANAFEVLPYEKVKVREMTTAFGDDGKIWGLYAQGKTQVSADDYRRISNWTIRWNGFPNEKNP